MYHFDFYIQSIQSLCWEQYCKDNVRVVSRIQEIRTDNSKARSTHCNIQKSLKSRHINNIISI